jgi:cytoskeletal protein CcmA (bactofilin family)
MALFAKEAPAQTTEQQPWRENGTGSTVSVLGPGISLDGKVTGKQNLVVEGHIKGSLELGSDLRIAPGARIEASVHAMNVTVEGTVTGDISAERKIELLSTARVDGNIKAPKIVVSEGARFRGSVDMGAQKPAE